MLPSPQENDLHGGDVRSSVKSMAFHDGEKEDEGLRNVKFAERGHEDEHNTVQLMLERLRRADLILPDNTKRQKKELLLYPPDVAVKIVTSRDNQELDPNNDNNHSIRVSSKYSSALSSLSIQSNNVDSLAASLYSTSTRGAPGKFYDGQTPHYLQSVLTQSGGDNTDESKSCTDHDNSSEETSDLDLSSSNDSTSDHLESLSDIDAAMDVHDGSLSSLSSLSHLSDFGDMLVPDVIENIPCVAGQDSTRGSKNDYQNSRSQYAYPRVWMEDEVVDAQACLPQEHESLSEVSSDYDLDTSSDDALELRPSTAALKNLPLRQESHKRSTITRCQRHFIIREEYFLNFSELQAVFDVHLPRRRSYFLDAGCGTSNICKEMVLHGYNHVYGIDISTAKVQFQLEECAGLSNFVYFETMSISSMAFPDNFFDCIFTKATIDVLAAQGKETDLAAEIAQVVVELFRCLQPGGIWIFVSCQAPQMTGLYSVEGNSSQTDSTPWWEWHEIKKVMHHNCVRVKEYRAGIPLVWDGKRQKPFMIRIYRRNESSRQRLERLLSEQSEEKRLMKEYDSFMKCQKERSRMRTEFNFIVTEMKLMVEEDAISQYINAAIDYDREKDIREVRRRDIYNVLLNAERKAMVNADLISAALREEYLGMLSLIKTTLDSIICVVMRLISNEQVHDTVDIHKPPCVHSDEICTTERTHGESCIDQYMTEVVEGIILRATESAGSGDASHDYPSGIDGHLHIPAIRDESLHINDHGYTEVENVKSASVQEESATSKRSVTDVLETTSSHLQEKFGSDSADNVVASAPPTTDTLLSATDLNELQCDEQPHLKENYKINSSDEVRHDIMTELASANHQWLAESTTHYALVVEQDIPFASDQEIAGNDKCFLVSEDVQCDAIYCAVACLTDIIDEAMDQYPLLSATDTSEFAKENVATVYEDDKTVTDHTFVREEVPERNEQFPIMNLLENNEIYQRHSTPEISSENQQCPVEEVNDEEEEIIQACREAIERIVEEIHHVEERSLR